MRLSASSMKIITPTVITITARRISNIKTLICPVLTRLNVFPIFEGIEDTIPPKIIRLIPLPTPRCVICSPIHIRSIVPVSIEKTDIAIKRFKSILIAPTLILLSPILTLTAWTIVIAIVT